ncbi:cytochrome b, partial [Escherichia coli]
AYSGKSWSFLGFNVSPFVTPNSEIKALIKNIHETWANIGYFLIAAHAGAALFPLSTRRSRNCVNRTMVRLIKNTA